MNDLEKLNFALEKQAEFAKGTTEWIDELKEKYANLGYNKEHVDSMVLGIVHNYMSDYAKKYSKKDVQNENV
jgi:hypothetical protein